MTDINKNIALSILSVQYNHFVKIKQPKLRDRALNLINTELLRQGYSLRASKKWFKENLTLKK